MTRHLGFISHDKKTIFEALARRPNGGEVHQNFQFSSSHVEKLYKRHRVRKRSLVLAQIFFKSAAQRRHSGDLYCKKSIFEASPRRFYEETLSETRQAKSLYRDKCDMKHKAQIDCKGLSARGLKSAVWRRL